jgi:hypothetical protein
VAPDDLVEAAVARAGELATLDGRAHADTKLRLRARSLEALRESLSEFSG